MKGKKILALLLALMLIVGSLPVSAFAVDTSQEDETESSSSSNVGWSESVNDVPVVYAQDPYSTIKNRLEGGTKDMTQYGVTRDAIVSHLESHEHDSFYLGTPYEAGDWQSPNGDTSYNGRAGMNCTGFVSYVLRKVGLDTDTFLEQLSITGSTIWAGSGLPYDLMSGASNYANAVENGDIAAYTFETKEELLSSGLAQKGDIILMWWSLSPFDDGADNHIGFFWGDSSSEDKMWHSSTHPKSGNQISEIVPKTPGSYFILIKTENIKEYNVTLTKTSADATVTEGNTAYSLAGATYNVYEGSTASGPVVATFTTDSSGHATINPPLEPGTYAVKEIKAPKGYKLDPNTHVFTIGNSDTTLEVIDDPGMMAIKVVKRDSQTGTSAQGNASLAGAVYRVSWTRGGETVTQEITSSADGTFPLITHIPFGTVTIQEIQAPPGYKLDTEVHSYYIDGSEMVTDTYELVPNDITEEVQRGGLTIQKKDSQTGTTPQGDASLAWISFEIVNKSTNAVVVNGRTAQPGQVAMTITTNASGVATTGTNALPYSGLIPGKTYKLSGVLMDKETEEPLLVDDKEVTSEVEFVAEKESGTVEMTFTLDASALVGKHIVVFETLYYNDKEIAAHTDIEDEDQTVLIDLNGRIFATKVDTDGAPVEGVVFGLFTADTTDFTEKNAAATAQTGADGKFEFDNVPAGDWLIVELVARPGYVLDDDPIEVTVDAEEIDLGEIVNEYTRVSIIKTDITTGQQLAGATLELYDPDGTLIDTWVSNGQPHQITKLAVGDGYVLKEISAPTGYAIADKITFSVDNTGTVQEITMQDRPRDTTEVPKTGQTTPPMFIYAGVLVLVVAIGVGYVIYRRKKTIR